MNPNAAEPEPNKPCVICSNFSLSLNSCVKAITALDNNTSCCIEEMEKCNPTKQNNPVDPVIRSKKSFANIIEFKKRGPEIVILGVGNLLMSDDGVGIHAAQSLALNPPPCACVVDAGTDVLSTLPFLEDATHALIIDAVKAGGNPGDLFQLSESQLRAPEGNGSAHAVNIIAGRHLLSPGANWPEILILGVEPEVLDYGTSLSASVAAALPRIERLSREIVAAWHKQHVNA